MPTAVLASVLPEFPPTARKVWTRPDCEALADIEWFQSQKLELIEGELIQKLSKGPLHSLTISVLLEWLLAVFGARFVQQERSIDVSPEDNPTSQPEPDLVVLAKPYREYKTRHPGPEDFRLVIEVSHSSQHLDLSTKARLYARAGILECWVADVRNQAIHVHRDPIRGRYASVASYSGGEILSPLAEPEAKLRVADIF